MSKGEAACGNGTVVLRLETLPPTSVPLMSSAHRAVRPVYFHINERTTPKRMYASHVPSLVLVQIDPQVSTEVLPMPMTFFWRNPPTHLYHPSPSQTTIQVTTHTSRVGLKCTETWSRHVGTRRDDTSRARRLDGKSSTSHSKDMTRPRRPTSKARPSS